MAEVFQALQAGGNVALVAIAFAIYRLEMRIVKVETVLNMHLKTENEE